MIKYIVFLGIFFGLTGCLSKLEQGTDETKALLHQSLDKMDETKAKIDASNQKIEEATQGQRTTFALEQNATYAKKVRAIKSAIMASPDEFFAETLHDYLGMRVYVTMSISPSSDSILGPFLPNVIWIGDEGDALTGRVGINPETLSVAEDAVVRVLQELILRTNLPYKDEAERAKFQKYAERISYVAPAVFGARDLIDGEFYRTDKRNFKQFPRAAVGKFIKWQKNGTQWRDFGAKLIVKMLNATKMKSSKPEFYQQVAHSVQQRMRVNILPAKKE